MIAEDKCIVQEELTLMVFCMLVAVFPFNLTCKKTKGITSGKNFHLDVKHMLKLIHRKIKGNSNKGQHLEYQNADQHLTKQRGNLIRRYSDDDAYKINCQFP